MTDTLSPKVHSTESERLFYSNSNPKSNVNVQCKLPLIVGDLENKNKANVILSNVIRFSNFVDKGDVENLIDNCDSTENMWANPNTGEQFKYIAGYAHYLINEDFPQYDVLGLTNCYGQVYSNGNYEVVHNESPSEWTFVYCVKSSNSSKIYFPDVIDNNATGLLVDLEPGKIFVFKSHMYFGITENLDDDQTILVKGNFVPTGLMYDNTYCVFSNPENNESVSELMKRRQYGWAGVNDEGMSVNPSPTTVAV